MPEVYVAAGSNLAPARHLACARRQLTGEFGGVRFSGWYRSRDARGMASDFINMVAGFATSAPVREVQAALRAIEAACGRTRGMGDAQVALDLDLLFYGELVCSGPELVLPRPELLRRAYMLAPLAELAPQLTHPVEQLTVAELWARFDAKSQPLERLEPAWDS